MTSLSVITINHNGASELPRTCRSVAEQSANFEWVVIDGGSSDDSLAILRDQERQPDVLVSEPDRGISHAFNKGIARASGDAVIFLNTGDEFANPDSLAILEQQWDKKNHRWIAGGAHIVTTDGRSLFTRSFASTPRDPWSLVRTNCQIVHQSVLAERSLFEDLGGYDERWTVGMDYDLWIRWLKAGYAPQVTPMPVCRFHRGGTSGDPLRNHREWHAIRRRHGVSNGAVIEAGLHLLAWVKLRAKGRYGLWFYRIKERLGIRI